MAPADSTLTDEAGVRALQRLLPPIPKASSRAAGGWEPSCPFTAVGLSFVFHRCPWVFTPESGRASWTYAADQETRTAGRFELRSPVLEDFESEVPEALGSEGSGLSGTVKFPVDGGMSLDHGFPMSVYSGTPQWGSELGVSARMVVDRTVRCLPVEDEQPVRDE